jgi:hypothetical protein
VCENDLLVSFEVDLSSGGELSFGWEFRESANDSRSRGDGVHVDSLFLFGFLEGVFCKCIKELAIWGFNSDRNKRELYWKCRRAPDWVTNLVERLSLVILVGEDECRKVMHIGAVSRLVCGVETNKRNGRGCSFVEL